MTQTKIGTPPAFDNTKPGDDQLLTREHHSLWWDSWRRLKKNRLAMVGLVIFLLLVVVALIPMILAPMHPNRQILEYALKPSGFQGNLLIFTAHGSFYDNDYVPVDTFSVSGDSITYTTVSGRTSTRPLSELAGKSESEWHQTPVFLLGTDQYGRDVLSRIIYGTRVSMAVGLFAELTSVFIGVLLGALAGFFRGWVDGLIMWFTNVIWSFPFILLVIAFSLTLDPLIVHLEAFIPLSAILGKGVWQAFLAIGLTNWVDTARIVRGQFFSLRETEYVEATRALGFGSTRTIFKHILPNALGPITVVATAGFATAIIAEASLSFLGLGVQPPDATWGKMIQEGYGHLMVGKLWGLTLYPSIAIALAVFGINMFGDGLRDALDPKGQ